MIDYMKHKLKNTVENKIKDSHLVISIVAANKTFEEKSCESLWFLYPYLSALVLRSQCFGLISLRKAFLQTLIRFMKTFIRKLLGF